MAKGTKGTSKKRDLEEFQADIEVIDVDDVDVDTPPSSAPTNTSDEQSLEFALIAQQVNAAREKRREEKESKFLKTTEHLLEHELDKPRKAFSSMVKEVAKAYSGFQSEYATCEDNIRKLWCQLSEEHGKLETLERAFHVKYECTGKEFEDSEIAGLSKMAASCEEVEAIVDKMQTGKD